MRACSGLGVFLGDGPQKDVFQRLVLGQVGQSILEDDLAGPDNHHFLAHLSHLGQDVGREHDGMRAGQFFDQGSNLDDLLRVESDGRLVQDQHRSGCE